jgi:TolB protein
VEDFSPAFSPDGRRIAFVSERDGDFKVYKVGADGSVVRNVTQKPSNPNQNPSWQAR